MSGRTARITSSGARAVGGHLVRHGWGILATLLAMVALSGAAYAVAQLPDNSVGTRQLRDHAVTLPKIASSARDALHGARGPRGYRGRTGPSEMRVTNVASSFHTYSASANYEPIAHIVLPGGTWAVTGSAIMSGPAGGDIQCEIASGRGTTYTQFPYSDDTFDQVGDNITTSVATVYTSARSATVRMSCRLENVNGTPTWSGNDIQLIAQRVGSAAVVP